MNPSGGHPPGRIGPNAILRVMEALELASGPDLVREVIRAAGLAHYLEGPPDAMVDEHEVQRLHGALREVLGPDQARAIGGVAGRLTGDYLLAHRIPRPAQALLKSLPRTLAGRLLLRAVARNAWTFTGTGLFTFEVGRRHRLRIAGCAVCHGAHSEAPLCNYYGASFERLFQVLVSPRTRVTEVQCQAQGDPACLFEVDPAPPRDAVD